MSQLTLFPAKAGNWTLSIGDHVIDSDPRLLDTCPVGTITDLVGDASAPHPSVEVEYTNKHGHLVRTYTYEYCVRKISSPQP